MMKLEVSMAVPTQRPFTDAFKSEAVRLIRESDRPVAQVARELGIADNLRYRWRGEQRQVDAQGQTRLSMCARLDELARLKRENETLKKERDFLTRAAASFARESP
jgi:transposase